MNAQNINDILDALAKRFGATGAHLWAILIRQQYSEAITGFLFVGLVVAGAFGYRKVWRTLKAQDPDYFDTHPPFVISSIILTLASIAGIVVLLISVQILINPEYYALKALIPGK